MAWGKNYVINLIYIVSMQDVRVKFNVTQQLRWKGFYTHSGSVRCINQLLSSR